MRIAWCVWQKLCKSVWKQIRPTINMDLLYIVQSWDNFHSNIQTCERNFGNYHLQIIINICRDLWPEKWSKSQSMVNHLINKLHTCTTTDMQWHWVKAAETLIDKMHYRRLCDLGAGVPSIYTHCIRSSRDDMKRFIKYASRNNQSKFANKFKYRLGGSLEIVQNLNKC